MKCNINELNLIANELYKNKEVVYHNVQKVVGMSMGDNGLLAYANNKYKSRYWKDIWSTILTISQSIVPIMALAVAMIVSINSESESKANTSEIQGLKDKLQKLEYSLNSQTNEISKIEDKMTAIQNEN